MRASTDPLEDGGGPVFFIEPDFEDCRQTSQAASVGVSLNERTSYGTK
jgi:hypothetical protein